MQETTPQQEQTFGFDNFESWMAQQPGKFAERSNPKRRILYGIAAIACALIIFWPEIIPWFPIWMIRTAAIIGALICGLLSYTEGTEWYSLQSGGEEEHHSYQRGNSHLCEIEHFVGSELIDLLLGQLHAIGSHHQFINFSHFN